MKMLPIGFSNFVAPSHIISIVSPDSAPIKRLVAECKDSGMLIDASFGRSTKAVIVADNGNLILSALTPDILNDKLHELSSED